MVQWLRLSAPNAGGPGSIPDKGTLPHMSQPRSHATAKDPARCNQDQRSHRPQLRLGAPKTNK